MVTGSLTGRMGLEAILPVKLPVTINTMLNFDGHSDDDGDAVGMCKQAFTYKLNFKQFLNDISFKVSACHKRSPAGNATVVLNSVLTNIN